jgi:hypothetical protein
MRLKMVESKWRILKSKYFEPTSLIRSNQTKHSIGSCSVKQNPIASIRHLAAFRPYRRGLVAMQFKLTGEIRLLGITTLFGNLGNG